MIKQKTLIATFILAIYVGIFLLFYFWRTPIEYLKEFATTDFILAPLVFVLLSFVAVVVAPITILPILPSASVIFGPFWAGTYILIGWILGSMTAFFIARRFGKPVLEKLISLESIEKYEDKVPKEAEFWWILLIRFIFQVDALSYAFGLFSRVSLWKFTLATLLGFAPTAYVVSYAGEAFLNRNFNNFAIISVVFIVVFLIFSYIFYRGEFNKE